MWWTYFKDRLVRPLGYLTGYEALVWSGANLAPAAQFYTIFLDLTAVGITVLTVYLLVTNNNRPAVAAGPTGATSSSTMPANASSPDPIKTPLIPGFSKSSFGPKSTYIVIREAADHSPGGRPQSLFRGLRLPEPFALRTVECSERWLNLWRLVRVTKGDSKEIPVTYFAEISGPFELLPGRLLALRKGIEKNRIQRIWNYLYSGKVSAASPLRGVIVNFDVSRLTENSCEELANTLTLHMRAMGALFRARFPVYILLSKAEALPDFREFTANLRGAERQQGFGALFPWDTSNSADREVTRKPLERLFYALAAWRVPLLHRETSPVAKPRIYEHPRHWLKLAPVVTAFIERAFGPLQDAPFGPVVRGLYVTSEMPVKNSYPKETTVAFPMIESVENLFLADLASRILPNDEAGAYPPLAPYSATLWRSSVVVTGVFIALIFAFSTRSWWINRSLLGEAKQVIASISEPLPKLVAGQSTAAAMTELAKLDRTRKLMSEIETGGYQRRFALGWGFYQGDVALPQLRAAYLKRFRALLLEPVLQALRSQFLGLSPLNPIHSYRSVADRLRLHQMVHGQCSVDSTFVQQGLMDIWVEREFTDPHGDMLAVTHFGIYARELLKHNPYNLNVEPAAVEAARRYLESNPILDHRNEAALQTGLGKKVRDLIMSLPVSGTKALYRMPIC